MSNRLISLRLQRSLRGVVLTLAAWALGILMFTPIAWIVLTSFKPERMAVSTPPSLFFTPTLDSYSLILSDPGFISAAKNSFIVTTCAVILSLALAYPIAYALAVKPPAGASKYLFLLVTTRLMPIPGTIVPFYLIVQALGGLDELWSLIWIYGATNAPLAVWMLRAYLKDLPSEILDAAAVDGAGPVQIAWRIVTPMIVPSLVAVSVLLAVFTWIEFFIAVTLTTFDAQTLPAFLTGFLTDRGLYWSKLAAVAVFTIIPILIAGLFVQRPLMKGFSSASK